MDQTESSGQYPGTNELRNGIDQSGRHAGEAAHEAVDRIADRTRPAVDRLTGSAHQAVDRMSSLATSAAETLQQRRVQLNTAGAELVDNARTYVRANPIAAISIAAAVGFILSRVLKSR